MQKVVPCVQQDVKVSLPPRAHASSALEGPAFRLRCAARAWNNLYYLPTLNITKAVPSFRVTKLSSFLFSPSLLPSFPLTPLRRVCWSADSARLRRETDQYSDPGPGVTLSQPHISPTRHRACAETPFLGPPT